MPANNLPSPSPSLPHLKDDVSSSALRRFDAQQQQQKPPLITHDDDGDGGRACGAHHTDPSHHLELKHDELVEGHREFEPQHECSDLYESDTEIPPEFAYVDLQTIRKEVQCPICLGIIKKTRTVMECLHRFCRECIDKSMRMGNNECPACRTHCASRRSLRDDPRFDAIIAALYPDVKKFEEEELAFCEEEETRNKQIQESIADVLRKQTEVVGKKRPANSNTATPSTMGNYQNASRKRRRRRRRNATPNYQDSDDNDADESDKHFDMYELHTEIKQRKTKSSTSVGSSHSPSSISLKNNEEESKGGRRSSPGLICTTEMLSWGKGGVRSNTRNNNVKGGMNKNARRIRLDKLVDFLRTLEDNDEEYVTLQTSIQGENVQALGIPDCNVSSDHQPVPHSLSLSEYKTSKHVNSLEDGLHLLEQERTLPGAVVSPISNGEQLIRASYQQKQAT